jgi:8-oxo-dGTP pyrophosphatase MutT (NUDIX family)
LIWILTVSEISVVPVDDVEFHLQPYRWRFAQEHRVEIDAHFDARRRKTPGIWNGRVLLFSECALLGRALRGRCFEVDFASFLAWRDWGCPDRTVTNCFAMGALQAADGAFVVGVMGAHTANAGRVYFPAGTPEPEDVHMGRVDFDANVVREVAEETGLTPQDFVAQPGWLAVLTETRVALFKFLRVESSALDLRARIFDFLAQEQGPEFADIRIVRGPDDLDPMMPTFVKAFFTEVWA